MGNLQMQIPTSYVKTRYQDGSRYNGPADVNGRAHGIKGSQKWKDDDQTKYKKYEGDYKQGKFHGRGTLTHRNGRIDRGHFNEDSLCGQLNAKNPHKNSASHITYEDENDDKFYYGSTQNGCPANGKGIKDFSNGDIIIGKWKMSSAVDMTGGNISVGSASAFIDGTRYYAETKHIYIGQMTLKGQMNGNGILLDENREVIHQGEFRFDAPFGHSQNDLFGRNEQDPRHHITDIDHINLPKANKKKKKTKKAKKPKKPKDEEEKEEEPTITPNEDEFDETPVVLKQTKHKPKIQELIITPVETPVVQQRKPTIQEISSTSILAKKTIQRQRQRQRQRELQQMQQQMQKLKEEEDELNENIDEDNLSDVSDDLSDDSQVHEMVPDSDDVADL
jgi:hypothetical protein